MESDTEADIRNIQEFSKSQLIATESVKIGEKELEIKTILGRETMLLISMYRLLYWTLKLTKSRQSFLKP